MRSTFILLFLCSIWGSTIFGQTEKQLFNRGIDKLKAEDYLGAEEDFAMVLQLNPRNDVAYFNRGFARLQIDKFWDALMDFSLALDINPANPEAYYNRGMAKLGLEMYLEAMIDFNTAIKGQARVERYHHARAKAKSGLEDFRGAIQDLSMCIKLSRTKNLTYFYDSAEAFNAIRTYGLAIEDLPYIIRKMPDAPAGYNARASVKVQANDMDGACLDWSKAGELGDSQAYEMIRKNCNWAKLKLQEAFVIGLQPTKSKSLQGNLPNPMINLE